MNKAAKPRRMCSPHARKQTMHSVPISSGSRQNVSPDRLLENHSAHSVGRRTYPPRSRHSRIAYCIACHLRNTMKKCLIAGALSAFAAISALAQTTTVSSEYYVLRDATTKKR